MKKAFFLDRDGVIIEERNYLADPREVALCPGAPEAIRKMREAGYLVIAVSNQSGIARGYFTLEQLAAVERKINALLEAENARIDAWYYCPHHRRGTMPEFTRDCDCRKPKPGLLLRAAEELDIDLPHSFLIGDKLSDIRAAENARCRNAILVLTGHGSEEKDLPGAESVQIETDILAAARRLLSGTA